MAKRRIKPELNLQPELPQVLSEDFILFYKPNAETEIAGLKEFTASLDNFISDAGTKIVLSKELKQKEVNSAQAEKDFIENKNQIFNANFYWPEKNVLAMSDNWILITPIYGLLRLTLSPSFAFTGIIVLSLTANLIDCLLEQLYILHQLILSFFHNRY